MPGLKIMLLVGGISMFTLSLALVLYDLRAAYRYRRALAHGLGGEAPEPAQWRMTAALLAMSWAPMLIALSIVRRG
jgi:hypothetical protein